MSTRRQAIFRHQSPPAEKATYLDFIRSRHTLQNALALSSYGPTSNAQYDQRYKSDADEQHYERDGVVFEPMPITGKHDVHPCFKWTARIGRQLPTRSLGGLLPPSPPGEKATTSQLVAPTRRRASRVGAKKLVDRLSTKAKVEDRKSVTSSAWPTPWSLGWSTPLQEQSRVLVPCVPSWFPGCRIFMGE